MSLSRRYSNSHYTPNHTKTHKHVHTHIHTIKTIILQKNLKRPTQSERLGIPQKNLSRKSTRQPYDEALVLDIQTVWITFSFPLFTSSLRAGVLVRARVQFRGQVDLFKNIFVLNRSVTKKKKPLQKQLDNFRYECTMKVVP